MPKSRTNVLKSDKGRILFVEDERMLVDMFHQYFTQHEYDFLSTKDIPDALVLTEFEMPDVVLLDLIIPKEKKDGTLDLMAAQGYDYLAGKKKNVKIKDVPVIVFTNLDTIEDRMKCASLGAVAYIFKNSVDPKDVLEAVDKAIKNSKIKKKK
jgi:CheY-like chemotaxis protein